MKRLVLTLLAFLAFSSAAYAQGLGYPFLIICTANKIVTDPAAKELKCIMPTGQQYRSGYVSFTDLYLPGSNTRLISTIFDGERVYYYLEQAN